MKPDLDRQPRDNRAKWPHAGDTPLQKARRIVGAYRARLKAIAPEACADVDATMRAFGETWMLEHLVTTDAKSMVTTADAAELAGVDVETVRQWRRRGYVSREGIRRHLQTRGLTEEGRPMFLASEVLEIAATTRQRRLRKRVT